MSTYPPMHKPTRAMLRAGARARAPAGATELDKQAYRDAAMLRAFYKIDVSKSCKTKRK